MKTCIVCDLRPAKGVLLCGPCRRAYDRSKRTDDGTLAATIIWTARRARRFARKGEGAMSGGGARLARILAQPWTKIVQHFRSRCVYCAVEFRPLMLPPSIWANP